MRISKRLLLVLVAVLLLLGAGTVAYAAGALPFTDIDGHWAKDSIVKLADQGIVAGHADGTFGPDEFVTRAQVVTFLDRLETKNGDCKACHNDTTVLTGKADPWSVSLHGNGELFVEEAANKNCAGCHSGGAFSAMVAAGQKPNQLTAGDANPTRQDCRACHAIHTTYTDADWALETTAPVSSYVTTLAGTTYDGGTGNLCAVCHQARRTIPAAVEGIVTIPAHYGPHASPQSTMLLGKGGAGATVGSAAAHYSMVSDTCVSCHMVNGNHTFEPNVAACTTCHAGAKDFNIGEQQSEVQAMLDELKTALTAKGLLNADGEAVQGPFPEAQAVACWNYEFVIFDGSLGVHNPSYTKALLQASIDALK